MRFIPLEQITISENRHRRVFDPSALSDLAESIAGSTGLLHAIVVRDTIDGPQLVSGERRLRAISSLHEYGIPFTFDSRAVPRGMVPTVTLGELPYYEARIAELSENVVRNDLTWQERSAAEAELHQIRSEQATAEGHAQTLTATASEIAGKDISGTTEQSSAVRQIREALTVAPHLDDPEVAKAKSLRDAVKIVEKKRIEAHYADKAKALGTTQTRERHTLLQGDALEILTGLPKESFDCILTDPPYGIDAQDFGTQVSREHKFDDSLEKWVADMNAVGPVLYWLAKPQAHMYLFCDPTNFPILASIMRAYDWYVWRTPLIWVKSAGVLPRPEHGPRRLYETILYAIKGDKRTTAVFGDVIQQPHESDTIHPDQKPVGLYNNLLRRSTRPGDLVLDPFCGSGTVFPAANQLHLTATGIEKNPAYFAVAAERLGKK